MIVYLTGVIASATVLYTVVAGWQLYEIHSGAKDTHNLAVAAGTQAEKMTNMSDAAEKIRLAAEGMVSQEQRIADNAQKALETSIATSRLDQRAWVAEVGLMMDTPEVGKKLNGSVALQNTGKTFAMHVKPLCHFHFPANQFSTEADLLAVNAYARQVGSSSVGVMSPQATYKTVLSSANPLDEADKARMLGNYSYIWGEITYYDVFRKKHHTFFCGFRKGVSGDFTQCPFHNDAD